MPFDKDVLIAILLSFILTCLIGVKIIPMLTKLKFGQFVRQDGPQSHLEKQGTPTIGGLMFILSGVIVTLVYYKQIVTLMPFIILTVGFAIVGFLDDIIKITKKQSEGLKAYQKFGLQLVISIGFLAYLRYVSLIGTAILVPFVEGLEWELGIFYYPLMLVVILGTTNGVNFTDGLDGLSSSVTAVVAISFVLLGVYYNMDGALYSGIIFGGLLGFLVFNTYPAKVFMGDTGSLALGGFVAAFSIINRIPLFIPLFGLIYLVEALSTIIQVAYYKKTKKRIFKMAPIHHHFELGGVKETRIVAVFTIVTIIMSIITLLAL